MDTKANKAIGGALSAAKQNSSKIKSVKIKIKFGKEEDAPKKKGLAGYANQTKMGATAMSGGPNGS